MNEIDYRKVITMKLPYFLYFLLLLLTSCEQPVQVDIPLSREWTIEELIADLSNTVDGVIEEEIHIGRPESTDTSQPIFPMSGEEDEHVLVELQTIYARIGRVVDGDNRDAFMYLVRRMEGRKAQAIAQGLPEELRPDVLRNHAQQRDQTWEEYSHCAREILPSQEPDCMLEYVQEVVRNLSQFTEETYIPSYPF